MNILAIDGPAGAGKSEVVKALAYVLHLHPLDAGSIYRAIAYIWNGKKTDFGRVTYQDQICIDGKPATAEMIRTHEITEKTPLISKKPEVRAHVLPLLRSAGLNSRGLIAEGRDMTTVVFPEARLKIFLTASPVVRARRIINDPKRRLEDADFAQTLADVLHRDFLDETRKSSPLLRAKDAILIDTSELEKELVIDTIAHLWKMKINV